VSVDREEIFLRKFNDERAANYNPRFSRRTAREHDYELPAPRVVPIRIRRRPVKV
jgi:hypothetical protein